MLAPIEQRWETWRAAIPSLCAAPQDAAIEASPSPRVGDQRLPWLGCPDTLPIICKQEGTAIGFPGAVHGRPQKRGLGLTREGCWEGYAPSQQRNRAPGSNINQGQAIWCQYEQHPAIWRPERQGAFRRIIPGKLQRALGVVHLIGV